MNEKNHCALIAPSFKNDESPRGIMAIEEVNCRSNTITVEYFHDGRRICILSRGHLLRMDCYISILLENCRKTSQKVK
ncbi:hypothetical protein T05_5787 [Trichinella murrelli]|uniref:Uncharacterized protein n=1 Tax=Trichinella murrelli TaxID=144512 RepID=A0A0V0U062_9BILA|nr:hypothetical protein T05_5787 [Trichinella murrelli]